MKTHWGNGSLLSGSYELYPDEVDHILSQIPYKARHTEELAAVICEEFQQFRHLAEFDQQPSDALLARRIQRVAKSLKKAITAMHVSGGGVFHPIETEHGLRHLLWQLEIDRPAEAAWYLREIFGEPFASQGLAAAIDRLALGIDLLRAASEHCARTLPKSRQRNGWVAKDILIASLCWHYTQTFGRPATVTTSNDGKGGYAVRFIFEIVRVLRRRADLEFPPSLPPSHRDAQIRNIKESRDHRAIQAELAELMRPNRIGNLIEKLKANAYYPIFLRSKGAAIRKQRVEKRNLLTKRKGVSGSRSTT